MCLRKSRADQDTIGLNFPLQYRAKGAIVACIALAINNVEQLNSRVSIEFHPTMNISFLSLPPWAPVIGLVLFFSAPVFAEDGSIGLLNQACDVVHQAWNPGGDPPSDVQRTDLLNQALKLIQKAHSWKHYGGHLAKAFKDIQAALSLIKSGVPPDKVTDPIHDAETELRNALAFAESVGAL
jgi:hypothetical protein